MMKRFDRLRFELDDAWTDESRIAFAEFDAPPAPSAEPMGGGPPQRLKVRMPPRLRSNFVVTHRPVVVDQDEKSFCEQQLKELFASIPNARASTCCNVPTAMGQAVIQELEVMVDGVAWKQLHAVSIMSGQLLHFVGTTSLGNFDSAKATFLKIVATMAID